MTPKKNHKGTLPKKLTVDAPKSSPMGKFHNAMQKIATVPKPRLKDK